MISIFLAASLFQGPVQRPNAPEATGTIVVEVDPEVELIARFAGFREYAMENSSSPYATAIEAHFDPVRAHPAVAHLRKLRRSHGVAYDAIASLAVHLGPLPDLAERVPFDADPAPFGGRLDERWGGVRAREFIALVRDFAREGHAEEFFAGRAEYYRAVETRLRDRLSESRALPWFDEYFGVRKGARYRAIPGLLCGGANYGVGLRFADGTAEEVTPIFGCWTFDESGLPVFDEGYLSLFVHELCHSYTNPIVDAHLELLGPVGERLFAARADLMRGQGYNNGRIVLYETFVRAVVVRCRVDTEGEAAGREQAATEVGAGFTWVPAVAEVLRVEADERRLGRLESQIPRINELLREAATALEAGAAGSPKLVASEPRDGATDVDPTSTQLVLTFDRSMQAKSWSIVGNKADLPEITGTPFFDADRRVLSVPVKLEPGRTYRVGLNNERSRSFRSADGTPLEPTQITFTTRGETALRPQTTPPNGPP